jgi:hypothetical protein
MIAFQFEQPLFLAFRVLLEGRLLYPLRAPLVQLVYFALNKVLSRIFCDAAGQLFFFQPQTMLRPRRDTRIPLRYRSSSPPRVHRANNELKRRKIDPERIDRNDADQALAPIAAAPEDHSEPLTSISTELPQFEANHIQNRPRCSRYFNLSELSLFKLFFSDSVTEIISKETNSYTESYLQSLPIADRKICHWVPTTVAEIYIYLGIYLHFRLYLLTVRSDY